MIMQKTFIVFNKGEQRRFLQYVKLRLDCGWKSIIRVIPISRSMFFKCLKEEYYLTEAVFRILINKASISESHYSFRLDKRQYDVAIIPNKDCENFAEFVGILLGDGHLAKGTFSTVITINSELEKEYLENRLKPLFFELFDSVGKIRYTKKAKSVQIYLYSKKLFDFLTKEIEIPCGRRINNSQNKIPNYFFQNETTLRACLRGLFDTEGSLSIRHHRAIRLSIYNKSNYLLDSLYCALKTLHFNPIRKNKSVRLNRTSEIIRFFNEIGSHNPYKEERYLNWLKTGKLENVHTAVL